MPLNWRRLLRTKKPWPVFIGQCLIFLALIVGLGWWFSTRYEIGIAQGKPCMRGRVYLIERRIGGRAEKFQRGDLIVFRTDRRTMPWYQPGTRFLKLVRGVPGDRVQINAAGKLEITGPDYRFESALEPQVVQLLAQQRGKMAAGKSGPPPVDFTADYRLAPEEYFVMGTLPDSYDSRYWGTVRLSQVVGKGLATLGQ